MKILPKKKKWKNVCFVKKVISEKFLVIGLQKGYLFYPKNQEFQRKPLILEESAKSKYSFLSFCQMQIESAVFSRFSINMACS